MSVVAVKTRHPPGFRSDWHASPTAQLIYPSHGVMTLQVRSGTWIVPPLRALWLPARERHRVETPRGLEMHSVYCRGAILAALPRETGVVPVSGLLRELILALETAGKGARAERLAGVFADQVALEQPPRLFLPPLRSARLDPIAEALRRDPADPRSLEDWARRLGVTSRTLARAFASEARMSFTGYRDQVRLHAALERLAHRDRVTAVALDLGFHSASSFIAMFKKATGVTPTAYFAP